jgi:hypothetical protein
LLFRRHVIRSVPAGRQDKTGVTQRPPPQHGERFPHFNAMRANNALQSRRHHPHGLHQGPQVRMTRQNNFYFAPGGTQSRRNEASLGAVASGEHEFAPSQHHAVQLGRIVQADQPAFHPPAGRKFAHHCRHMAARALHPAGCIQFREESDEHALSLPRAAR